MNKQNPIFIVGSSRSGTTLLSAMLNAHPNIACGPESQILNKIKPRRLKKILSDPNWPQLATTALTEIDIAEQRVVEAFGLTDAEVAAALQQQPPGIAALFEAIAGLYASKQGKTRWAEKTPRHLLHLDTLRAAFPHALIIRTVRDPRDSARSMRKLPWASNTFLANLYLWNEWYERSDDFFARDKLTLSVSYEQLVIDPQHELERICQFIGEPFDTGMLNTGRSGAAVATEKETWKRQVSGPLDHSRIFRWKQILSEPKRLIASALCEKWLKQFGYTVEERPMQRLPAWGLERRLIEANYDWLLQRAMAGDAYVPQSPETCTAPMTFFIDDTSIESWRDFLRIMSILLKRRLCGRHNLLKYSEQISRYRCRHHLLKMLANAA